MMTTMVGWVVLAVVGVFGATAGESPDPPVTRLCGPLASEEQRTLAAETLEREGALVKALLAPDCHVEGLRAALPRVLRRFDAVCPGPHCLGVLTLARRAQVPEWEPAVQTHARTLVALVLQQPVTTRRDLLVDALGLQPPHATVFHDTLDGRWQRLSRWESLPTDAPGVLALLEQVRLRRPEFAPHLALLRERLGLGAASLQAFQTWTRSVPCEQLEDAVLLALPPPRLRLLAEAPQRCRSLAVDLLRRYAPSLSPPELMWTLAPLTGQELEELGSSLELADPNRAEALVDWVVDRQPRLLEAMRVTEPVVRKLLAPRNVDRLGGRDAVLDLLLRRRGHWRGTLEPAAQARVFQESLQGSPPPERVRHLGTFLLPAPELSRLLAGALASSEARMRAAAAAGLAERAGRSIPPEAARACLGEVRERFLCIESLAERMEPPPLGVRYGPFLGCGVGEPLSVPRAPPALEEYCLRLEQAAQSCAVACGGRLPVEANLSRLEAAAREPLTYPSALRACAYGGP